MTGDVYIGGEPFDVDDDTRTLIHLPCGEHLFGDGKIAAHRCWVSCISCGMTTPACIRRYHFNSVRCCDGCNHVL